MPELKHYENTELNSAYIYTNLPPFDLEREWIEGSATFFNIFDDSYSITGNASGNGGNGS